jgi:hypothetical protein
MPPIVSPDRVDEAIVAMFEADTDPDNGLVALCPGGIHHLVAPEGVALPCVVFATVGTNTDTYTLGGRAFSTRTYVLTVIDEGHSAERASTAARRLGQRIETIAPVGWQVLSARRTGWSERIIATEGGTLYQQVSVIATVVVSEAP